MIRVFAVHTWETFGNYHSVHFGEDLDKHENTKHFKTWKEAEEFANRKAIELGLDSYTIDTPDEPHVRKQVRKLRGS